MIEKNVVKPIYIQIMEEIKRNIENGIYVPDQMLPSERELCEIYNTSRMTVRQAVSELVNEGALYKKRNRGTFVKRQIIEKHMELKSFTEDMIERGFKPGNKIINFVLTEPLEDIKEKLSLKDGEKIYILSRLRLANYIPMAIETSHLPVKIFPDLLKYNMEERSLYDIVFNDYKIDACYIRQTMRAVKLTRSQAQMLLNKSEGFGLMVTRIMFTTNNVPVGYTYTIYHPDRYVYNMILTMEDRK